jgi:hypothetical protein
MTPKQLVELLDGGHLSQRHAAQILGIDERTMRRYIAGQSEIPRAIELALHHVTRIRLIELYVLSAWATGIDSLTAPHAIKLRKMVEQCGKYDVFENLNHSELGCIFNLADRALAMSASAQSLRVKAIRALGAELRRRCEKVSENKERRR